MNLQNVPARHAQIEWSEDRERRVTELIVFDRRLSSGLQRDSNGRSFKSSHGACLADWMDGKRARTTPEGVFALLMRNGFVDDDAWLATLDQFGKIDEAGWARTMAEAFRERLRSQSSDEEAAETVIAPVYGSDINGTNGLPFYVGVQWKVDAEGMDTINESYFIERERLGHLSEGDEHVSSWPPHLPEKNWVDLKDFEAAFRVALKVHSGAYGSLDEEAVERGFALAHEIAGQ